MTNELGNKRFEQWWLDSRVGSFASRLLAEWVQWRCGCASRQADAAMRSIPVDAELATLVAATFKLMNVVPTQNARPPRRGLWRKSSGFASLDHASSALVPKQISTAAWPRRPSERSFYWPSIQCANTR